MGIRLCVTQRRSAIGREKNQRRTLEALGIRRMHQSVIHEDTPQLRGMIFVVKHLVHVESVEETIS